MPDFTLHAGNSLEVLKGFPADTFDSIVTDPPYGLGKEPDSLAMLRDWVATGTHAVKGSGFMGREWDSFVPQPALWAECLRVLKPGGHVLAFAGTRTQDLMGLGLRLAGFQIRDTLAWVYGTGFPKSLDVARAIDATDRIGAQRERALRFTAWMRETGLSCQDLNALTASNMGSHYLTDKEQPQVATEERFAPIREALQARGLEVPEWVEGLVEWRTAVSENLRRREIVGTKKAADLRGVRPVSLAAQGLEGCKPSRQLDITAPHTLEARAWAGWGTALKPGYEPIILARKPLVGTVADNIREHGTGALNIGACLVGDHKEVPASRSKKGYNPVQLAPRGQDPEGSFGFNPNTGRWPANFLHDGSEEVLEMFPDAGGGGAESEARFFYCPKASREDRDEGLDLFPLQAAGGMEGRHDGSLGSITMSRNIHPTVKPTDLMRWLVRLVTRPGGLVLDPFMGSGSTGKAAILEGMRFEGIDLGEENVAIAQARISYIVGRTDGTIPPPGTPDNQLSLF